MEKTVLSHASDVGLEFDMLLKSGRVDLESYGTGGAREPRFLCVEYLCLVPWP